MKALIVILTSTALALTGCGTSMTRGNATAVATPYVTVQGAMHGGQQPVAGATVQLYAVNANGGYGSISSPLLAAPVKTTAFGNFTLTGQYTCPSASTLVYLVGTGGDPGLGSNNPNLALMAALGPCGNLTTTTFIQVNELTTIASVYALAPFMNSYSAVGTSAGNLQGLTNAFATVNNLVNIGSGMLSGPTLPANAVLPTAELNTLADIIAMCINSAGGVANDRSSCGYLFEYTTPPGGAAPTDTISAALNIARYPSNNAAALVMLSPPASPYLPMLASATDFTVSIKYKTGGFNAPSASAIDAGGNVWVTNSGGNSLSVLNPAGSPVAGSPYIGGGLSTPSAIAFDPSGNAWIADAGTSALSVFTPAGVGTLTGVTGLASPSALAMDGQGMIWITNPGNSTVTAVTTSGTTITNSTSYSTGGVNAPVAVAVTPF